MDCTSSSDLYQLLKELYQLLKELYQLLKELYQLLKELYQLLRPMRLQHLQFANTVESCNERLPQDC